MMTAGRLPLAFGKARTAPMPPPYLIIVGVIPVDFFAAIIASIGLISNEASCSSVAKLSRVPVIESRHVAILVWCRGSPYIHAYESKRWRQGNCEPDDDRTQNRPAPHGRTWLRVLSGMLLRVFKQSQRETLVPEYAQKSCGG